ncbi:MAG: hypothetical protein SFU27_06970 [Thermonemataceae bacterium]|nr:hypothetical protein [Thermonemataceae bacterium]
MKLKFLVLASAMGFMFACGGKKEENKETKTDSTKTETPKDSAKKEETASTPTLEPGKFPFDFPVIEKLDAAEGDNVFYVNMKLVMNDFKAGRKTFGTQYLLGKLSKPGEKESTVQFVSDEIVPNAGIIKIPAKETVKVGDIVAGKWAVNMTRAIITDASNPDAPKAIFIGLDYDNPAKGDDKTTGIGQYAYTLKQGEFIKISEPFAPASCCVYKKGSEYKLMNVFRAEGDKVLGTLFTQFTAVPKADCTPIPLKATYKVGDAVYAPWVGGMYKGKITAVNAKMGRYNVKFDDEFRKEKMIAFGEVIDKLP